MTALAELVNRKPASISHYEKGRIEPPAEVVHALSKALDVQVGFFFKPPRCMPEGPTFHRSLSAATKRARLRAERRIDWTFDILRFLEGYVDIPSANLPPLTFDLLGELTDDQIEIAAHGLRRYWGLGDGPIPNLVWLVEQQGVVVVRDSVGNNKLDAHSRWCGERPIIVLNSDKRSSTRSRFDCAHELGHVLFHRNVSVAQAQRSENRKRIEAPADRFGGAFMMPAETFAEEVGRPTLEGLLALKSRWRMSVAAMLVRCAQLGLVGERRAELMWRSLSRRGWRRREPFDDSFLPEQPRMFNRAFDVLVQNNLASREAVIDSTHLADADIENLSGLARGFLRKEPTQVYEIGPRAS